MVVGRAHLHHVGAHHVQAVQVREESLMIRRYNELRLVAEA